MPLCLLISEQAEDVWRQKEDHWRQRPGIFWKSANTSNTQWKCDKYAKSKQIQNILIKIHANVRLKTCKEVDSECSAWVRKRSVANLLRYIIETLSFIGIFCCQIFCCNFVEISPRLRYLDIHDNDDSDQGEDDDRSSRREK